MFVILLVCNQTPLVYRDDQQSTGTDIWLNKDGLIKFLDWYLQRGELKSKNWYFSLGQATILFLLLGG